MPKKNIISMRKRPVGKKWAEGLRHTPQIQMSNKYKKRGSDLFSKKRNSNSNHSNIPLHT